uniref:Uncharacterized protein n=1 Tax=Anguilla anguilla TaxID=7936 RepID=A0A0E9QF19_ANGAN
MPFLSCSSWSRCCSLSLHFLWLLINMDTNGTKSEAAASFHTALEKVAQF